MSPSRGAELASPISLSVDERAPISLHASRSDRTALLKIGWYACEIQLEPIHVQSVRNQLPDVLKVLDRAAADQAASQTSTTAGKRAADAAACAQERAVAAKAVGADGLAAAAQNAAASARAAADVADAAVRTVIESAAAADRAADVATEAVDRFRQTVAAGDE